MGMIETSTPSKLATLRQESERTWRTDPTTVNAYNYFSDNSISKFDVANSIESSR